jgi:hypothetical protein
MPSENREILWSATLSCFAQVEIFFSLQLINGMAQLKKAKFGDVDMNFVLGIGGYDLDRLVFFVFLSGVEAYWTVVLTVPCHILFL